MLKLSEQQSEKLVSQLAGIITIIAKAAGVPDVSEEPATGMRYEELAKAARREYDPCPFGADFPPAPSKPQSAAGAGCGDLDEAFSPLKITPFDVELPPAKPESKPFTIYDYDYEDCAKRVEVMNRLCGRWTAGGNRCGIEIERRGEHFILYHLKRNGIRTEDRYALLWNYGEVYYYCPVNRVVVLAFDTETDTLMISPGVDYTRVVEAES